jgi:hypothetical protein
VLGRARTDKDGYFKISYERPRNGKALLTGEAAAFFDMSPNMPDETSTLVTFNSLANLLAVCVNDEAECPTLLNLTTPPGGKSPRNTLQAVVNIVHFPSVNAVDLVQLSVRAIRIIF